MRALFVGVVMQDVMNRRVPAGFFLRFLLDRPRSFSVGLMLTVLPMGTLALIAWLVSSMDGTGPDFAAMVARGTPVNASVVSVEPVHDITINHRNPVRITYRYKADGVSVLDMVQTMEEAGYRLLPGQGVAALHLNGDSALPDFPPVAFSRWSIVFIDGLFLMMGLPFLLYAFYGASVRWRLYKSGEVLSGGVDSVVSIPCVPFTASRIQVAYTSVTDGGEVLKGASVVLAEGLKEMRRGSEVRVLYCDRTGQSCVVEEGLLSRCGEGG